MNQPRMFTREGYRSLMRRAQSLGYSIVPFCRMPPVTSSLKRVLLNRHDLDHSLRSALLLGRLESELNVTSTYFVQVACPFYNLLSGESRAIIRELRDMGHEIGLHYDTRRYDEARVARDFAADRAILEAVAGCPILSASQHVPIDSSSFDVSDLIAHEAYSARFTQSPMTYVSDSLMRWRQATPCELLDAGRSFQLLTHPVNWVSNDGVSSVDEVLDLACAEEISQLERCNREVKTYYRQLLKNRTELDRSFRARRTHFREPDPS